MATAFKAAMKGGAEALNVLASPLLASLQKDIRELAESHRLPAIFQWKEPVEDGGLVSYGPSLTDTWRQAPSVVGKIPIAEPTKFELVINLKTAKTLGLTISLSRLLRADHVIE